MAKTIIEHPAKILTCYIITDARLEAIHTMYSIAKYRESTELKTCEIIQTKRLNGQIYTAKYKYKWAVLLSCLDDSHLQMFLILKLHDKIWYKKLSQNGWCIPCIL